MASIDSGIGIAVTQVPRTTKELIEPPVPSGGLECRGRSIISASTGVFDIEDANLRIAAAGNQSPIIRVWHKLDGEDVGSVAGQNGGIECEWSIRGFWLVGVYIEVLIVRARCQKTPRS